MCGKDVKPGEFSVEDDTRPEWANTSVTKAYMAPVKDVVQQDARLSVKDIASCLSISEGSMQTILNALIQVGQLFKRLFHLALQSLDDSTKYKY